MEDYVFSYSNYEKLCENILETGRLCNYSYVLNHNPDEFIILRHDVEFSPERAYNLAKLESKLGIASTYFFQMTNNAYNILSSYNIGLVKGILEMKHQVGLHFHLNDMTDLKLITKQIKYEIKLLSYYLKSPIDCFSFHRPTELVLKNCMQLDNIINAYDKNFFTYFNQNEIAPVINVKYVADSKNQWQYTSPYTYPSREFFQSYKKVQILCHPYSWTLSGYDTLNNLKSLISENQKNFITTLDKETKYAGRYLVEL